MSASPKPTKTTTTTPEPAQPSQTDEDDEDTTTPAQILTSSTQTLNHHHQEPNNNTSDKQQQQTTHYQQQQQHNPPPKAIINRNQDQPPQAIIQPIPQQPSMIPPQTFFNGLVTTSSADLAAGPVPCHHHQFVPNYWPPPPPPPPPPFAALIPPHMTSANPYNSHLINQAFVPIVQHQSALAAYVAAQAQHHHHLNQNQQQQQQQPPPPTVFVNVNDGQNFHVEVGGRIQEVPGPATVKMSPLYQFPLSFVPPCYCSSCISRLYNATRTNFGLISPRHHHHHQQQIQSIVSEDDENADFLQTDYDSETSPIGNILGQNAHHHHHQQQQQPSNNKQVFGQNEDDDGIVDDHHHNLNISYHNNNNNAQTPSTMVVNNDEDDAASLISNEIRLLTREADQIPVPKITLIDSTRKVVVKFRKWRVSEPIARLMRKYNLMLVYSLNVFYDKMRLEDQHHRDDVDSPDSPLTFVRNGAGRVDDDVESNPDGEEMDYREIYRGVSSTVNIVELLPNTLYKLRAFRGFAVAATTTPPHPRPSQCFDFVVKGSKFAEVQVLTGAGEPNAPESVQLVSVAPRSLIIDWENAFANGSPVSHYELEMSSEPHPLDYRPIASVSATTLEITEDIDTRVKHFVRIRAVNEIGPGPFTNPPLTLDLPKLYIEPPKPPSVRKLTDSELIAVEWAARKSDTFFYVQTRPIESSSSAVPSSPADFETIYSGDGVSFTTKDLIPGRTYEFRLGTSSNIAMSAWSESTVFKVQEPEKLIPVIDPPVNLRIRGLTLEWTDVPDSLNKQYERSFLVDARTGQPKHKFVNIAKVSATTNYTFDQRIDAAAIRVSKVVVVEEFADGRSAEIKSKSVKLQIQDENRVQCSVLKATVDGCVMELMSGGDDTSSCTGNNLDVEVQLNDEQEVDETSANVSYSWESPSIVKLSGLKPATDYIALVSSPSLFPRRIAFSTLYLVDPPRQLNVIESIDDVGMEPQDHPTVPITLTWSSCDSETLRLRPDHRVEHRLICQQLACSDDVDDRMPRHVEQLYVGCGEEFKCSLEPNTAYEFSIETSIIDVQTGRSCSESSSRTMLRHTTRSSVPDVPQNVRCSKGSRPGSVEVSLVAPVVARSNGSPVEHLVFRLWKANTVETTAQLNPNVPNHTIDQLTPGQLYQIDVFAVNAVGSGKPLSLKAVRAAPFPPLPPTQLQKVGIVGVNSLKLRWSPPKTICCASVTYNVELSDHSLHWRNVFSGTKTTCRITKLTECTQYSLRVFCSCNVHGRGHPCEQIVVLTAYSNPDQMNAPRLKLVDSCSCYVYWSPATITTDNGSTISTNSPRANHDNTNINNNNQIQYELELQSDFLKEKEVHVTTDLEYRFKNLRPNTSYCVKARAIRILPSCELYSQSSATTHFRTLKPQSAPNPVPFGPFDLVEAILRFLTRTSFIAILALVILVSIAFINNFAN